MKFRTSFFNPTVLKKDITRFAPVWILYSLLLLIVAVVCASNGFAFLASYGYYSYRGTSFARNLATTLLGSGVVCCGFALLNAQLLFGDLFKTRLCNALHALPIRREGWFATHVVSGILFSLVPNLLMMIGCAIYIPTMKEVAVYWFLMVTMQYLFYFGLAVFCVMCTGSRVGMTVVYGLSTFGAWLIKWLVDTLYIPLLPGFYVGFSFYAPFCPLAQSIMDPPVTVSVEYYDYGMNYGDIKGEVVTLNPDAWVYLAVIAVVGVVLMLGALWMYRKRNLESAGDFIAAGWLKPVFLVAYTLAVGALFENFLSFTSALGWTFLVVGLTVGYFTGQMFLMRTIRVMTKRVLAGFAAFACVLLGTMGLTALDPLDLEHWVPAQDQIRSVNLTFAGFWSYELKDDQEVIREIRELHQVSIDAGYPMVDEQAYYDALYQETADFGVDDWETFDYAAFERKQGLVTISYSLNNGIGLTRSYDLPLDSPATELLVRHLNRPEHVFGYNYYTPQGSDILESIDYNSLRIKTEGLYYYPEPDENRALMDAIMADIEACTMAQHDRFHAGDGYSLTVRWGDQTGSDYGTFTIKIYPEAVNTLKWLEDKPFYQEYLASLETEEAQETE